MPTESGDLKLLGNYRKLIDHVSAAANYDPANPNIATAGLETHYSAALASVDKELQQLQTHLNELQKHVTLLFEEKKKLGE